MVDIMRLLAAMDDSGEVQGVFDQPAVERGRVGSSKR
jgi:hypothetical protein